MKGGKKKLEQISVLYLTGLHKGDCLGIESNLVPSILSQMQPAKLDYVQLSRIHEGALHQLQQNRHGACIVDTLTGEPTTLGGSTVCTCCSCAFGASAEQTAARVQASVGTRAGPVSHCPASTGK